MIRAVWTVALFLTLLSPRARAEMAHPSAVSSSTAPVAVEGVVNLNSASEEQLGFLPGIGPGKAKAIADYRRVHPFHRADELTKVKGIGRKTFGHLRAYLTVAGPTTLPGEVKMRH